MALYIVLEQRTLSLLLGNVMFMLKYRNLSVLLVGSLCVCTCIWIHSVEMPCWLEKRNLHVHLLSPLWSKVIQLNSVVPSERRQLLLLWPSINLIWSLTLNSRTTTQRRNVQEQYVWSKCSEIFKKCCLNQRLLQCCQCVYICRVPSFLWETTFFKIWENLLH